jgi:two-component system, LuxR family, sensor kinase FixL
MGHRRKDAGRALGAALAVAAAYYLGARLGFTLTLHPTPVSTLWPPNALLLAGLLLTPPRWWAGILTATLGAHLAVQIQEAVPIGMVLCWFVSNCAEALLGAMLLRRLGIGTPAFDRFRDAAFFVVCAVLVAPFLSSFLDVAFVRLNGWGTSDFWTVWRTRFFSNVLATLTLVPVIVTVARSVRQIREVRALRWIEAGLGLAVLLLTCWLVFVLPRAGSGTSPSLTYAVIPLLLVAALRFGPIGASVSSLVCAFIAISGAVMGRGPFVASTPLDNALAIQLFFIVAQITLMLLAAVMTDRVRAEERARTNQQQLELALSAARLVSWDWDMKTDRIRAADSLWQMLGIPEPDSHVVETMMACVHPDDRQTVSTAVEDALRGGALETEFRVVHADGTVHWVLSRGTTLYDERGAAFGMIGVNVEISARRQAEAELQEQRRQVAHLGRVAVVGELSIALAHELRQPLAAILANARAGERLLGQNPPDLSQVRDILADIAADDARAADVITRLRALLRNDAVSREPIDLNEVVREALLIARPDIAARNVSLETRFEAGLPRIAADRIQLQQVLLNLVINACEAMESVPIGARRLIVATCTGIGAVDITVTDAGSGIPPDRLEQVFEAFVTTKPQGLGLGLSICRSIVTAHGGQLVASNTAGGGAALRLSLPARNARAIA